MSYTIQFNLFLQKIAILEKKIAELETRIFDLEESDIIIERENASSFYSTPESSTINFHRTNSSCSN